jgi:hypothetical protein
MNDMHNEKLIEGYLQNTCSSEEAVSVLNWFSTTEGLEFVANCIDKDIEYLDKGYELYFDHPIRSAYMYEKIDNKIILNEQGLLVYMATYFYHPG